MEIDELQKTWDQQDEKSLYVIDQKRLQDLILSKKKTATKTSNLSEVFLMMANIIAPVILVVITQIKGSSNLFSYSLAILMLCTAAYIFTGRLKRLKSEAVFDKSMHGDLLLALSNATFQVRLSQIMRWYTLPVGVLTLLAMWDSETSLLSFLLILLLFGIAWVAGRWEHQFYVRKMKDLEILKEQLTSHDNI